MRYSLYMKMNNNMVMIGCTKIRSEQSDILENYLLVVKKI